MQRTVPAGGGAQPTDEAIHGGESVLAAAVQLNATDDKARNLATADRLTRAAAAAAATLVVLPEKWSVIGTAEHLRAGAEPLDGRDKLANTSVHVGPDGEIKAVYRKIHMFDVEVAGTV